MNHKIINEDKLSKDNKQLLEGLRLAVKEFMTKKREEK